MFVTREVLAQGLLLLLISPWLGVARVLWARRGDREAVGRAAISNAVATALVATAVIFGWLTLRLATPSASPASDVLWESHWFYWTSPVTGLPWFVASFALGIDHDTAVWLLVIPWSFVAALQSAQRSGGSFASFAALLSLESLTLAFFAAHDSLTRLITLSLATLLLATVTAHWGNTDRRAAAERLARQLLTADVAMSLGVFGLVTATTWCVGLEATAPAVITQVDGHWHKPLTEYLPQSPEAAEAWFAVEGWLCLLLGAGLGVRAAWIPLHPWWTTWVRAVEPPLLTAGVWLMGPAAHLLALKVVIPACSERLAYARPGLLAVFAGFSVYTALLTLAQTDLRRTLGKLALTLQSFAWLGVASLTDDGCHLASQLQLLSAVLIPALAATGSTLQDRYETRELDGFGGLMHAFPRWTAVFSALTAVAILAPVLAAGGPHLPGWIAMATCDPLAAITALISSSLVTWSLVWWWQRLCTGPFREPRQPLPFSGLNVAPSTRPPTPADLSWDEVLTLLLPVAVALSAWLLIPELWP